MPTLIKANTNTTQDWIFTKSLNDKAVPTEKTDHATQHADKH